MNGTGKSMGIWRRSMNYRLYRKLLTIVLLMSFWKIPVYGEPLITQMPNSDESVMKRYAQSGETGLTGKNAEHFYTESEVDCLAELDLLIEDLSGAAYEAIEQAAAEAARVAVLASLEREAAAIREAQSLQGENNRLTQSRVKTAVVTGLICFFGGLALGAGTTAIRAGR
jgi:hypothetical protein